MSNIERPADESYDNALLRKYAPDLMARFDGVSAPAAPSPAALAEHLKSHPAMERTRLSDGRDYYILPADDVDTLLQAISDQPAN